jgi:hypothetical protein
MGCSGDKPKLNRASTEGAEKRNKFFGKKSWFSVTGVMNYFRRFFHEVHTWQQEISG